MLVDINQIVNIFFQLKILQPLFDHFAFKENSRYDSDSTNPKNRRYIPK